MNHSRVSPLSVNTYQCHHVFGALCSYLVDAIASRVVSDMNGLLMMDCNYIKEFIVLL